MIMKPKTRVRLYFLGILVALIQMCSENHGFSKEAFSDKTAVDETQLSE